MAREPAEGGKAKAKSAAQGVPKRLNRAVGAGEALGRVLDPALRKRGFASRDLVQNWASIVPAPYDRFARPDKLVWPRSERGADGAILFVSCHAGSAVVLAHETDRLARAINRYYGYVLVGAVKLSATPFETELPIARSAPAPAAADRRRVASTVADVALPDLKDALRQLGEAIVARRGSS